MTQTKEVLDIMIYFQHKLSIKCIRKIPSLLMVNNNKSDKIQSIPKKQILTSLVIFELIPTIVITALNLLLITHAANCADYNIDYISTKEILQIL